MTRPNFKRIITALYGSQRKAAEIHGVTERTIRRWVSGNNEPPPEAVDKIRKDMKKSIHELLTL